MVRRLPERTPDARSRLLLAAAGCLPAILLAVPAVAVHDVGYLLRHPFWIDEAWVAVSTRAPLSRLPLLTSSTPIGWTWLLRLVPGGGPQHYRLLPLACSVAAVVLAYYLGRTNGALPAVSGVMSAGAVLFLPALLIRNDLKQYTADAAVAVLLLLLLSRLDAEWSRPRLAQLCGAAVAGAVISSAALLVGAAAVTSVAVTALLRRSRERRKASVVAVGLTGLGLLAVFMAFVAPAQNRLLTEYWRGFYLPTGQGVAGMWTFLVERATAVSPLVGVRFPVVALILVLAGLVALAARRRWSTALTPVVLIVELTGLSALHRYPFLDVRTSTFLLVVLAVCMATGLSSAVAFLAERGHRAAAAALMILLVAAYLRAASPYLRSHTLGQEDVRSQVEYVEQHWRTGDLVLVNLGANWGFGYYARWQPRFVESSVVANGFLVTYPAADRIHTLQGRERLDVLAGLRAVRLQAARSGARLWIVRSHVLGPEAAAWAEALRGLDVATVWTGGPEPLMALHS